MLKWARCAVGYSLAVASTIAGVAFAQIPDRERLQGASAMRVLDDAQALARRLGLGAEAVSYCQTELMLQTQNAPLNGAPPYGVNWRTMQNRAEFDQALFMLESHQKISMRLCLAKVKSALERWER